MKIGLISRTFDIARQLLMASSISVASILALETAFRIYITNSTYRVTNKRIEDTYVASDKRIPRASIKKMLESEGVLASLQYREWTEIGNSDHSNEHSEVSNGARKTFFNAKPSCRRKKSIWFFGGSTTYGTGTSWDHTLPSYVAKRFEPSDCISIVNYGTPYHYSLQEKVYFTSKLLSGDEKPDIVIFVDGLNDFIQKRSTHRKQSFFTPVVSKALGHNTTTMDRATANKPLLNLSIIDFLQRRVFKNAINNYSRPIELTRSESLKDNAFHMIYSSKVLEPICKMHSILCIQYLQPIPALHYPGQKRENISKFRDNGSREDANLFYTEARSHSRMISGGSFKFFDASRVFENYSDHSPYVDGFHYSNGGNKSLASFVFRTLESNLDE